MIGQVLIHYSKAQFLTSSFKFELKKLSMKFETNQGVLMVERSLRGGEFGLEL